MFNRTNDSINLVNSIRRKFTVDAYDMSRVHLKTRASARLSHTLKRHYDERDESGPSRKPNVESDGEAYGHDFIIWRLTLNTMDRFSLSLDNHTFHYDDHTMRLGRRDEYFRLEGNDIFFHGTATTRIKLMFVLPDGRLSISWYGGQLIIDDTYSIVEQNITMWHHVPHEGRLNSVFLYVRGERSDPITLKHAHRSYIIRLNDSYPAVVMSRCAYYPLKLALFRDFVAQMGPDVSSEHIQRSPGQLADDPRVPSATPRTPSTPCMNISPQSAISDQTPPTHYVRCHPETDFDDPLSENEQSSD